MAGHAVSAWQVWAVRRGHSWQLYIAERDGRAYTERPLLDPMTGAEATAWLRWFAGLRPRIRQELAR